VLQTILNVYHYKFSMQKQWTPCFHHQWLPDLITLSLILLIYLRLILLRRKGYLINEKTPCNRKSRCYISPSNKYKAELILEGWYSCRFLNIELWLQQKRLPPINAIEVEPERRKARNLKFYYCFCAVNLAYSNKKMFKKYLSKLERSLLGLSPY
jgi:hypothetical protein